MIYFGAKVNIFDEKHAEMLLIFAMMRMAVDGDWVKMF
jgi:hypothetical protein